MKKPKVFHLGEIEPKEIFPGFEARFIHSKKMSFAYWEIEKGSELTNQAIPHEQVISMVSGKMELKIGKEKIDFHEGMVVVIPSKMKYSTKAITKCKILDVANPRRKDLE